MSPVTGNIQQLDLSRATLDRVNAAIGEGNVTPAVISAGELAQTQVSVQTELLKETLAAQSVVLDLLV